MNSIELIATIYFVSSIAGLAMAAPQAHQLVVLKRSDELNLGTWTMWLLNQIAFMFYMFTLNDAVTMVTSVLWTLFYAAMLGLIVYYRKYPRPLVLAESVDSAAQK